MLCWGLRLEYKLAKETGLVTPSFLPSRTPLRLQLRYFKRYIRGWMDGWDGDPCMLFTVGSSGVSLVSLGDEMGFLDGWVTDSARGKAVGSRLWL